MSWAKLSVMAVSAWLLAGCTAAELDALNDSLACVNEFPNDTYRQNQCISYMNEAREVDQYNALLNWCQTYAVRPIEAASPKLERDIETFDRNFESLRTRIGQVSGYYSDYCDTPERRRSNSSNADYLADRKEFLEGGAQELRAYLANW
ncbi:hypothetical protein IDSA_10170 [Pseudidiomarina salinarum]|uniref:Lipoprotein n=1 Tax=Pseudidiomarina salinarum TaxID=435908 RepID=A0A094IX79_9GAMM|nr:hypothetical protein [Pseudidiomarina salinarum]KFZ30419.1 hypothetical protein IDSA_10170 [Pseudidiomarina salinarum]RUO68571.1 hypothetical protein CWI79_10870 [Pseudidiomarina salinarum]